jgi:glycerol-3-phosphate cytidylyltransferase
MTPNVKSRTMPKEKIIVYTGGTFDMFHSNHIKIINYARGLGDVLIVGVSTDELVCTYKSPPTIPFEERIEIIRSLKQPDIVIPQNSLDHTQLVEKLNIDVFAIGDDWTGKYDYLKELGVKVFYFPYGVGVSSTMIKLQITSEYLRLKSSADIHPNPDTK